VVISDNDLASSPQNVAVSGVGTDFSFPSLTGAGASGTLTRTSSASYSLSVSGASNFADIVSFACAGLPQNTQCIFTPPSASPGPGTTTVMLSVSRISSAAVVGSVHGAYQASLSLVVLALIVVAKRRVARGSSAGWPLLFVVAAITIVSGISGCGGGGGGSVQPPPTLQPAAGSYQFTVTATALGQSKPPITLTLIVE
jgi:hypothetical protein